MVLDVRGLRCPVPYVRAKAALAELPRDEPLVVLATDPEARIDLAALAADTARRFAAEPAEDGSWRLTLAPVSVAP